jgi:hypothetical protein
LVAAGEEETTFPEELSRRVREFGFPAGDERKPASRVKRQQSGPSARARALVSIAAALAALAAAAGVLLLLDPGEKRGPVTMRITSVPTGVDIFIDDEFKGTTGPKGLVLSPVAPGKHRIVLMKAGYDTCEGEIVAGKRESRAFSFWLMGVKPPLRTSERMIFRRVNRLGHWEYRYKKDGSLVTIMPPQQAGSGFGPAYMQAAIVSSGT